jgi:hypothetical protein
VGGAGGDGLLAAGLRPGHAGAADREAGNEGEAELVKGLVSASCTRGRKGLQLQPGLTAAQAAGKGEDPGGQVYTPRFCCDGCLGGGGRGRVGGLCIVAVMRGKVSVTALRS